MKKVKLSAWQETLLKRIEQGEEYHNLVKPSDLDHLQRRSLRVLRLKGLVTSDSEGLRRRQPDPEPIKANRHEVRQLRRRLWAERQSTMARYHGPCKNTDTGEDEDHGWRIIDHDTGETVVILTELYNVKQWLDEEATS